jgi:predicted methyltransferase
MTRVIEGEGRISLDDLVVRSRTPVRTALLVLRHLQRMRVVDFAEGLIAETADGHGPRPAGRVADRGAAGSLSERVAPLSPKYIEATAVREAPCLIWGQRRLVPRSALERADHISDQAARYGSAPHVVFLGDDDLVSPLVAAAVPGGSVTVADIDAQVLAQAERVAAELGGELATVHADLSGAALELPPADIVVCDPYPSGDGSFEAFFWLQANACLRSGGLLITTIAPSHKPEIFSRGALGQLDRLSFQILDLKANFGRYEVFGFEFTPAERAIMHDLGGACTISHTKSLVTARAPEGGVSGSKVEAADIDFVRWSSATLSHYLTLQAGVAEQVDIANSRGLSRLAAEERPGTPEGMVLSDLRPALAGRIAPYLPESRGSLAVLLAEGSADSSEFGLALRAIESWERWRLEE